MVVTFRFGYDPLECVPHSGLLMPFNFSFLEHLNSRFRDDHVVLPPWLNFAGLVLIYLYAFSKISFADAFDFVEAIFVIVLLYGFFRYGGTLRSSLPLWLVWASIAVVLITWVSAQISHPEWAESNPRLEHLARHFLFVLMAFWLAGSERKVLWFFGLALLGLLFSPWSLGGGWGEVMSGLQGERIDFGIRNSQHTGILFGLAALFLLVFFRRLVLGGRAWLRGVVWLAVLGFCLYVVFATHTRSVPLAFAVLALIAVFVGLWLLVFRSRYTVALVHHNRVVVATLLLTVSVAVVALTAFFATMDQAGDSGYQRLVDDVEMLAQARSGDLSELPRTSMGYRVVSWRAAVDWFAQRPITGWGGNAGGLVIQHTDWLQAYIGDFSLGHLHNSYVEVLVRYGLLGFSIYLVLMVWTARGAHKAWKNGNMPGDFLVFFLVFFVFWAIVNLFESYMFYGTGVYVFNLVMAALLSFIWADRKRLEKDGPVLATDAAVPGGKVAG
jgi:O-antigen ligase